jgi:GTPase SAR1 family protein
MDILSRYTPKILNDIVGNRTQINKMREAFRINHSIIILGVPGSGKTTVANLLCTEYNTLVVTKENLDSIPSFIADKTITSFFDKRKKAILFDDIDVMIHNDKTSLSFFIKVAQDTKDKIPCIFTCNQNDEKKILDLKKHAEAIKLFLPTAKECFAHLMRILERSGFEYDVEILLKACHKTRGNIREAMAEAIHGHNEEEAAFKNMNIFETIRRLLTKPLTKKDTFYLIDEEPNIVSCMYYENIPEEMYLNRTKDLSLAMKTYASIVDIYMESTVIEDFMCKNHEWALWDLIYHMRFVGANAVLMDLPRTPDPKDTTVAFSQILSKVSHKNIMGKRLRGITPGLSLESKILLADRSIILNDKQRKQTLSADENNFVATYVKYFAT